MDFFGSEPFKLLLMLPILCLVIHNGKAGKILERSTEESDQQPNLTIIEGDIVADKGLLRMIERSRESRQKRVARKTNVKLWHDGLIPYSISTEVSDNFRKVLRRAFRDMAEKTCIRFIPKRTTDKDFILFKERKGCYSSVGRQHGGQVISLGKTCETRYRALHEIMHALGFMHEHSRPDRDQYIKILYWNIEEGEEENFNSYSNKDVDTLSEPYDFNSILHYNNKAFSKNGQDTIQALNNPDLKFGHAKQLSPGDIRKIRKLYKCDRRKANMNGKNQSYICRDIITGCRPYADRGDACESNYIFMNTYCQQACGFCGTGSSRGAKK